MIASAGPRRQDKGIRSGMKGRNNYQGKQCLNIHLLKQSRARATVTTGEAPVSL